MKNIVENIAIFLVAVLSLVVVFLIVEYNMIEENTIEDVSAIMTQKKITPKAKTNAYLNSLENYGNDVDVKVDAKKEDKTNEVVVKSELNNDDLGGIVEDKTKASYLKNLENYEKSESKKNPVKVKKSETEHKKSVAESEPVQLPKDESAGAVGFAIDALLDDEPVNKVETPKHEPKEIGENSEVSDDIGMAIDAAVNDL